MPSATIGTAKLDLVASTAQLKTDLREAEGDVRKSAERMGKVAPSAKPAGPTALHPPEVPREKLLPPVRGLKEAGLTRGAGAGEQTAEEKTGGILGLLRNRKERKEVQNIARELGMGEGAGLVGAAGKAAGGTGLGIVAGIVGVGKLIFDTFRSAAEERRKSEDAASVQASAATSAGFGLADYKAIAAAAGEDKEMLRGMAVAMRDLREQGVRASEGLKDFGRGVERFKGSDETSLALAGEARNRRMAEALGGFGSDGYEKWRKAEGLPNNATMLLQGDAAMAKWERKQQEKDSTERKQAALFAKSEQLREETKTPERRLTDKIYDIQGMTNLTPIEKARAVVLAQQEFEQAAGEKKFMGPALEGSQEAYRTMVQANFGGTNGSAEADAVIIQYLPELVEEIKRQRNFQHEEPPAAPVT